ncbi:MAG: helix-turn-helix domain-containing protein [Patescibacteria group bacterium]
MSNYQSHTKMKNVGEMLKNAREKKNLTYAECYKFIRVHPKYLEALEEGNYKPFSGSVHIKGFLKNYAKLLELNVDEVLAFWRREYDESRAGNTKIIRPLEGPRFLVTPASVVAFSVVSLMVLFFSYLFYQYKSFTGSPSLTIDSPKADTMVSADEVEVSGRTDKDSSILLNGEKIPVNPDGTFVTRVNLLEGLNTLNFYAVNKLGKETKLTRTVVAKKTVESASVLGKKTIKLEVLAGNASSVLLVFVDEKEAFNGNMLTDSSKIFEASNSVKIRAENAGALSLKLNGVDLGAFGKKGEVKEQEFK